MLTSVIGNEDQAIERKDRLERDTCNHQVLPEYVGNIENSGWSVTPQPQIFYEQLLWSQSCISHICNTELFYSIAVSDRWATQGLWSTINCTWWVAAQNETQALQTLYLQGAPSESRLLSLTIGIRLRPLTYNPFVTPHGLQEAT